MKTIKKLTILHSNDLHGDFLAEKIGELDVGGVSMLSGFISKVREEEENVIYAIAGDMFRGSIIDSEYKGLSTIEIMNMLSPDIVTIGNHEIDYGIAHLLFIEKCAQFPIINANLYIKSNGTRLFTPFKIISMDNMKILFIGIITEEVMATAKSDGLIGSFIDTAEAAREVGKICNTYNAIDIDFTVLLTHIGIEEDIKLAEILDPEWGVDLIIGGHSHTFMEEPITVNDIVIAQAGEGTDNVGRFDINVNTDDNCIDSYKWQFIPINQHTAERDEQLEGVVNKYKDETDRKYQRIITRLNRKLTHPQRNMETSMGSLFADIYKESLGLDIMFLGSGSIRGQKLGPIIEHRNLLDIFPYDDQIYMLKVDGSQLKRALKHIFREEAFQGTTEYYQFSKDFRLVYDRKEKEIKELSYEGVPVADQHLFHIGLQQFHFMNTKDFLDLSEEELSLYQRPRIISTSAFDTIIEYLSSHHRLNYKYAPRVIFRGLENEKSGK